MNLTLRNTKGSALTHTELDDNFSYLDSKIDGVALIANDPSATTTSRGSTFMDIRYVHMFGGVTQSTPNLFIPFATTIGDDSIDYIYKIDASTILIKAGTLYKLEGNVTDITDNEADYGAPISFGLYSDVAGTNLIKSPSNATEYLASWNNAPRDSVTSTYIKSDVDCYLKLKMVSNATVDASGFSLNVQTTLTKYNTTPTVTSGTLNMPGYSTTETLTEKRWIDGKPIYRKVVDLGTLVGENAWNHKTVALGITDIEKVIDGQLISSAGSLNDVSFFDSPSNHISYYFTTTSFIYTCSTNQIGYLTGVKAIVEYTKTTDTSSSPTAINSLVYAQGAQELPGYKSTETLTEKRWIDGKPIYRKVITYVPAAINVDYIIDTTLTSTNCLLINSQCITDEAALNGGYDRNSSTNNTRNYLGTGSTGVYFAILAAESVSRTHYIWLEYTKSTDTAGSPVALVGGVQDSFVSKFVGCSVISSGTQSVTASTYQKITILTNKEYDTNSMFDTTSQRFTAKISGYYKVNGLLYNAQNTAGDFGVYLYKNGVRYRCLGETGSLNSTRAVNGSAELYLNTGDYLELYGWISVTSPIIVDAVFQVSLIAPNYGGQNTLPNYSTTETLTSERWIDGKPIYRKVIPVPTITYDGVWRDISLGNPIAGYETIVSCKLRAKSGELLPDLTHTDLTVRRNWVISSTLLSCAFGSGMPGYINGSFIVYEYTKTTDTSSSPVTTIGGSGTPKKYFARISNGTATTLTRGNLLSLVLSNFYNGDREIHNGSAFVAPQDDVYTTSIQFFSSNALNANITEIGIMMFVNGIEDARAFVNPGSPNGANKGCNGTFITKLKKNDVITFKMQVWATDTVSALQIPAGSIVSSIRN